MAVALFAVALINTGCLVDGNYHNKVVSSHNVLHPEGEPPTKANAVVVDAVEHHESSREVNVYGPLTVTKKIIGLPFEVLDGMFNCEINVGCNNVGNAGYSGPVNGPVVVDYIYVYSTDDFGRRHCFKAPRDRQIQWRHCPDGVKRPYWKH